MADVLFLSRPSRANSADYQAWKELMEVAPKRYVSGIGYLPYETDDRWLTRNLRRMEAENARLGREGASGFPQGTATR